MTKTVSPFPLIMIDGAPLARGRQYGEEARERIVKSIEIYRRRLASLGLADARGLIARFIPEIERFGSHYVEEMRGIAEGAAVPLDDIVLINARTEIVALAQLQERGADGCTGVIVLPERSAEGRLIHAQNWDWLAECADTAIVLRIHRNDGPDILTFTEAGGLARSGFNSAGVAITANYLESDRDYRQSGIPLPLIRRKALEQEHLALAIKAVATTPKACSNNMMLSGLNGFAIDFECEPDECFPLYPDGDLIVHANHWLSPVALGKLKDKGIADVPESFYRDWRVRRLLDAKSKIALEDVKSALFDDFGSPFAVCRPPFDPQSGSLSATVAMIVMEPSSGIMDVAPMPAHNRQFTRYRLQGEPQALN
jgi:isopenicillin-N N-acyltransferase-like protein